ncbi:alpha/beta hydrolase fold domain-containing protein [Salinicola avicenniae]|uniref:alpha/beta hydrolase fold domain-containing protein n=1 Tax=Salinicola avicenniae TaxID=2916836 RepID=UPI002073A33D|nr:MULTISPECIES: alpha/beta hydrolase fold domain-containing protein [unclassified Salinicola]
MQIETFIRRLSTLDATPEASLAQRRRLYEALHRAHRPMDPVGLRVTVDEIDGVRVRRFLPASPDTAPATVAPVVYLHGGGWNLGSTESHHGITADLAARLEREVISVDYRLLPEASYAQALADCRSIVTAVAPDAIIGDSAGGRLAIDVAATADWQGVLGLVYPVVGTPTLAALGDDAPLLTRADILALWEMASAGEMPPTHPHRPPTRVIEALAVERDPLTRPLESAVEHWRDAGAAVGYRYAPNMVHSALHGHADLPAMRLAWQDFCEAIMARLAA